MEKPYRFFIDRVSAYADEGAAFLRRRRLRSRPFARVWRPGGTLEAHDAESERGQALFLAAARVMRAGDD